MSIKEIKLNEILPGRERRPQGQRDDSLMKACKDFEAVYTYQLLKSMRATIEKCDLFHGGGGEEIYESLLDQELSKSMADGSYNGLASMLYRQLKGREGLAGQEEHDMAMRESVSEKKVALWPVEARVSSEFGWRIDPITGENRFHQGLDLAAREGTPVRAPLGGRVIMNGFQEGYGNVVVLDHGQGITTLYGHNRENLVREGEWVEKGAILAEVGSSGRSTGPHLHFEVRRHGRHLDPLEFFAERADGAGAGV